MLRIQSLGDTAETLAGSRYQNAAVTLLLQLYDWIQVQMTVLSRDSDTEKALSPLQKPWVALNLYCGNGWAKIDNNIAENALRGPGGVAALRYRPYPDWPVNRLRDLLPWKVDLAFALSYRT